MAPIRAQPPHLRHSVTALGRPPGSLEPPGARYRHETGLPAGVGTHLLRAALCSLVSLSPACGVGDGFVDADDDGVGGRSDGDEWGPHGAGVPSGFVGPVTLRFGDGATCGDLGDPIAAGYEGLLGEPAVCGACSCEVVGCDAAVTVTRSGDDDAPACSGCAETVSLEVGACVNLKEGAGCGGGPGDGAYAVTSVALSPATCTATSPPPVIPPIAWMSYAVVCAPSGAGLVPGLCIAATGERECPAPWTERRVLYASHADTRGCSDCGCTPPACAGTVELYDDKCDAEHATGLVDAPLGSTCAVVSDDKPKARFVLNPSSMQCQAVGSEPVGQATGTEPTTVCCTE